MNIHNGWKKTVAFLTAFALVTGGLPANVGGFLTGGTAIVASAETVDGVNFNETWSSTSSLPVPDHDSYTGLNDKSHFGTPNKVPTTHNYSMANNITLSGTCFLPLWKSGLLNTNYNYYELRYSPLISDMSVRINLNNHSINANGQNILSSDYSHSNSFEYGFYGTNQSNEIISGANSLGNNYGGKWVLSGVKLTGFENIADLNSSNNFSYYILDPAILNMKNTTASCVNGVKLTNNGQLTLNNSSITATGDYAVDVNNGSFTVNGTSNTINGKILLNDNTITFASGAKLTTTNGTIPIKWTGTSLNGAPRVFTSGAKNATSNNLFTGDGCYVVKDSSTGEWYAYASTFTDLSGGAIFDLEPSCYVINGQTPTLSYTVKDAKGDTVDSSKYTVSYKKGSQNVNSINSTGTYTLVLTAKSGSGYTGTVTKDFYVNILNTKGTKDFGGRTFYQLTDGSYAVTSDAHWNALVSYVNGGGSCSGMTFKLMSDVSITQRMGSYTKYFNGTFDGNGYTIDANISINGETTSSYAAPFAYVNGATIQNLTVIGSIQGLNPGGVVGENIGSSVIKDCVVKASVKSKVEGYGCGTGGIVGLVSDSSLTVDGCVFEGTITGAANNKLGSFIGLNRATSTVKNSITTTTQNISYCGSGGITDSNNFNLTNSATVTCGENVSLNLGSRTDTFGNNAFVKVYNNAIQYDGKTYVQYGKTVNVTLTPPSGYSVKSVKVNNGSVAVSGSGNSRSFTMPSGTANVTAEFEKSTFTVTWVNGDGTILKTQTVNKGTTPSYGSTPTMPTDEQYTYTFTRWSPAVTAVTADTTYTAQYEQIPNTYTVTWKNADGTVLETDTDVPYGTTPTYNSPEPTKTGDAQYTYTFTGWDTTPVAVTGDVTYTAQFSQSVNKYTVTWKNANGTILGTDEVAYGETPAYNGTPTKAATAQYTYTFSGWSPKISAVTGDATYMAQYSSTVNKYTVIWKNGDTVLETDENVEYGTTPTYDGAAPIKTGAENEVYVFSGWDTNPTGVTGDANYTAQFIKYTHHAAVAPTYEAAGNIEYYTDESGAFYTDTNGTLLTDLNNDDVVNVDDTVLAKLQPSMNIVASGSKYDVNVYIPIAEGAQLSDYTVTFGDVEQPLTAVGNTNYGSFTIKCAAKNMADINTLVLKQDDTVLYSTQLSAAGYLKQFENDATYGNMAKSMLRYGAAAQTYFNVGGTLANDGVDGYGLDSLDNVTITDNSPSVADMNTAFALTNSEYYGMNMTFDSDTSLLIAFKIKTTAEEAKSELEGKFTNAAYTITCEPDNSGKYIIVKVANIPIKKLGDTLFTFGNVEIKATDYLARIANNNEKSEELRNLCKALYKFYESTK